MNLGAQYTGDLPLIPTLHWMLAEAKEPFFMAASGAILNVGNSTCILRQVHARLLDRRYDRHI